MSSLPRVFIVDDDVAAIQLLSRILEPQYTVCFATSGADALTRLGHDRCDIVLLDAQMPGMDGFELLRRIKRDPYLQGMPVVFVTAHVDEANESLALALGAADFITKPFSPPVVHARVANVLRLYRDNAENLQRNEARWIFAVEGAEQGVWDWDLREHSVTLSQQWRILLGDDEGAGDTSVDAWRARVHPDDAAAVQRRLDRHRRGISSGYESEHRMRCGDGSYVWVLEGGRVVQHDEAGRPMRMIGTLSDISRRKEAEAQAFSLAFYDPVTELPNRRRLVELLRFSLVGDQLGQGSATLCLVDLDHFKLVNDAHGHDVGDQLLRQVAVRLKACVRQQDIVARLGGDEFAVLLMHERRSAVSPAAAAEAAGAKLLAVLAEPYAIGDHLHHCSASMGVVAVDADKAEQAEQLLKWADIALYEAKRAGRGCLRFFDPAMQAAVEARSALEAELRTALACRQFQLVYQLQVGDRSAALGAEALVRWHHPQRGVIGPTEFIALAEETGLIVPLGRVLLEQVCEQLCAWERDADLDDLTVALNISARELHEPDFVDFVLATLARTGAPVRRLKLELTESALVGDVDDIAARMHRLRDHGVGFSLDDFGTGFSSLSYLKRLPFDQLKIDRSFVRDILEDTVDARLSRAIVALAASLGLSVVAEGVELAAQGDMLREFGCRQFQGFLYGVPMPAAEFSSVLRAARREAGAVV
ncbi:response regulator receiver modulated diguanylate cyclase/phosphodiesterase with PAS/PAC sensor(s) [Leptothrix cholodnii SP-6]|uniref:Response regulator receiver modulated diguanylate cyclase/phosphodiesterase with PAS/PAC sensor(S) n=1 Tax=Leptothrix cholodnii (strain ATCC 51168 / LMG 8142 / SP-6) TaxID=395495 RepID=B1Y3L9_LEPCP|nr:EAL domain-containing response regulator [Leptothrix cholodnii]ACB35722.1 response regulator receiver modulated diguanylate cyclase/phosphodiesterase with PAS/PAC sensor(s) [Leptothrix cholodnii SP-6]